MFELLKIMSNIFDTWCATDVQTDGRKKLQKLSEVTGGRQAILPELATRVESHYVSDDKLSGWIKRLGFDYASACVRQLLPTTPTGMSGDLGEIIASELIEEKLGYAVPVKKLRDKDHRQMAMRGEDVIGVGLDAHGKLRLLKGESKSAQALSTETVVNARKGLDKDEGRPTPHALIFLGSRMGDSSNAAQKLLGDKLMIEAITNAVPLNQIAHYMFTMTGNPANSAINEDFANANGNRDQHMVNLRIPDHANFVQSVFQAVNKP